MSFDKLIHPHIHIFTINIFVTSKIPVSHSSEPPTFSKVPLICFLYQKFRFVFARVSSKWNHKYVLFYV